MQSILLVGENPALQLSRAAVLSRLGVAVDVCGGADAVARIGEKRYAVVVLCHSFFGLGEDEMIQKARETSPETVVFKVIPEHWWKRDLPQDAAAVLTGEPNEMLDRIGAVLARMEARSPERAAEG